MASAQEKEARAEAALRIAESEKREAERERQEGIKLEFDRQKEQSPGVVGSVIRAVQEAYI